jgi:DNA-binding CsgD family transcriptional regulator
MQKKTSASSSCAATAALTIDRRRLAVLGPIRRECEILQWLEEGMDDGDITKNLSLSPHTAEKGVRQVFEKLIVKRRAAVVNYRYSVAFSAPFQLSTSRRNSRATGDNPLPINPLERRGKRIPQKRKHR